MSRIPVPVAYDISVCLHDDQIEPEPFKLFGAGAHVRVLRRNHDGSLRCGLVDLPAGWCAPKALAVGATLQVFVRTGSIMFGDDVLGQNAFVTLPGGSVCPVLVSDEGAELITIFDDEGKVRTVDGPAKATAEAIVTPDVFATEPIIPVVGGKKLEGFERRVLWEDPETGADTRLLRVPAGFTGAGGPSFHPVEEEIFCLDGDIAPDDQTPMRAGSYLWNPRLAVHGFREHSQGGCVLLEWHDGPWEFHRYEGESMQRAPAN